MFLRVDLSSKLPRVKVDPFVRLVQSGSEEL